MLPYQNLVDLLATSLYSEQVLIVCFISDILCFLQKLSNFILLKEFLLIWHVVLFINQTEYPLLLLGVKQKIVLCQEILDVESQEIGFAFTS
jgi:hypothetical protein